MPELTIQLVTWNSAAALRESLPTLQLVDPSLAVIRILDNGSTDESVALVRQMLPEAQVVQLGKNTGFAGGHNAGFERCTTPYVLVLNPDVALSWDGVRVLLDSMRDPHVGAAQGKLFRNKDEIDSAGVRLTAGLNGRELGAGEKDHGQYNKTMSLDAVSGACALYRVSALREVAHAGQEIFDRDFWAYKEDVDLSWRLRRAGWNILYVPVVTGTHVRSLRSEGRFGWPLTWSGIRRRLRDPRTVFSWRNWLWMVTKNATAGELLLHAPGVIARLGILVVLTLVYWPMGRVWQQAVRGLPRMIAKRRQTG